MFPLILAVLNRGCHKGTQSSHYGLFVFGGTSRIQKQSQKELRIKHRKTKKIISLIVNIAVLTGIRGPKDHRRAEGPQLAGGAKWTIPWGVSGGGGEGEGYLRDVLFGVKLLIGVKLLVVQDEGPESCLLNVTINKVQLAPLAVKRGRRRNCSPKEGQQRVQMSAKQML